MTESLALEAVLLQYLRCSAYRLNFVASFVVALIGTKTVNLVQVATMLNPGTTNASNCRRIQRFFESFLKTLR